MRWRSRWSRRTGAAFSRGREGCIGIQRTVAEADADIIEVDLRATLDQQVVVFHDRRMDHRSTCSGSVESRRYEELAACHLRNAGAPLPRFSEILAIARGRAIVDAEFKTEAAIAPAIRMVIATGAVNAVYFQLGSNRERYRQVRAYSPDINVQFKATSDDDLDWALSRGDAHLRIIEMDRDFLDADRIARVHAAGKLVSANTWRYQYTEERFSASCARAFHAGVDIAVTNNAASCSRQRYEPPYSALHEWAYRVAGRPHVRALARQVGSGVRDMGRQLRERLPSP